MNQTWRCFFSVWCFAISIIAAPQPAAAQEVIADTKPKEPGQVPEWLDKFFEDRNEASLKETPKRQYKIEKAPVQRVKLFKTDPKLLENKFRGEALLFIGRRLEDKSVQSGLQTQWLSFEPLAVSELPRAAPRLIDRNASSLFVGRSLSGFGGIDVSASIKTNSGYFKLLTEFCPRDELPAMNSTSYLTSPDCDRDVKWGFANPQNRRAWVFEVYAPSEELAEQRLSGLLRLLDCGLCRPLQRECLAEGRKSLAAARARYEELTKFDQAIEAEDKKLANPSEITPEILTQLKAQKVMVAIELAGLNARLKACNEMLKEVRDDTRPPSAVQTSISDMKVRAEVDLVGIKEKLDRINAFISEGTDRERIKDLISHLRNKRSNLRQQIQQDEERAFSYARLVDLYAPLELKENQITISPVEWTN